MKQTTRLKLRHSPTSERGNIRYSAVVTSIVILAFGFATVAFAGEKSETVNDPSKPTNINTKLEFGLEYRDFEDGYTVGPRLTVQTALSETFGMEVGATLLYPSFDSLSDNGKAMQLGDTRVRALWTPTALQRKPGLGYFSGGIYLDSFLPTGQEKNGAGSGALSLAPGIISGFGLNTSGTISIWPIVSYVGTFREIDCDDLINGGLQVCEQGEIISDELQAGRLDLPLVFSFPSGSEDGNGNQALTIWPSYTKLISHDKSSSIAVDIKYQYMLTPRSNMSVNLIHNFDNRDSAGALRDTFNISYSIFF